MAMIKIGNDICMQIQNIGFALCYVSYNNSPLILNSLLHVPAITKISQSDHKIIIGKP